jgi:hypothetical protein
MRLNTSDRWSATMNNWPVMQRIQVLVQLELKLNKSEREAVASRYKSITASAPSPHPLTIPRGLNLCDIYCSVIVLPLIYGKTCHRPKYFLQRHFLSAKINYNDLLAGNKFVTANYLYHAGMLLIPLLKSLGKQQINPFTSTALS